MKTYKLHLIRHGLTQGNLDGIYVGGGLDIPLCQEGVQQLEELRAQYRYPGAGTVFSSPMRRALQTAEILYPEAPDKIVLEELRENVFGEFEGKKVEVLMADERFARWLDPGSGFVPEGGESGAAFAARTAAALMTMMEYLAKNGISEAVCITHGGVIMSMLGQLAMPQKPPAQWMADNGCGFTVQADAGMIMRDRMVEAVAIVPAGYLEGDG